MWGCDQFKIKDSTMCNEDSGFHQLKRCILEKGTWFGSKRGFHIETFHKFGLVQTWSKRPLPQAPFTTQAHTSVVHVFRTKGVVIKAWERTLMLTFLLIEWSNVFKQCKNHKVQVRKTESRKRLYKQLAIIFQQRKI